MKENEKKAFDFAADVTKQLITLSTAIITITITFSKDIINFADNTAKIYLICAWVLFIVSIFFGIWTLLALTGSLQSVIKVKNDNQSESKDDSNNEQNKSVEITYSINTSNIRIPSIMQIGCFIVALSFTVVYGFNSINNSNAKTNKKSSDNELRIIRKTCYKIDRDSTLDIDTLVVK